jgi:manganese/iron transport system ATP-binding protein
MTDLPHRLELDDVSISYGAKTVVEGLTFQVPHGARVAVVGPNGAGKSTLFKAIVGLLPLQRGRILIHGLPLGDHQDCVAYVPQREEVDWRFPITVREVVMMGRYGQRGWFRRPSDTDRSAVDQALAHLGISGLGSQSIGDLSGGQQQRVFLARALAQDPHILLMDEPFTGVDVTAQDAALSLLDDLHAEGVTAIISTHDLSVAASRFDYVLLLNRRLVAFGPPADVLREQNLAGAFGTRLLVMPNGAMLTDDCCPPDDEHEGLPEARERQG